MTPHVARDMATAKSGSMQLALLIWASFCRILAELTAEQFCRPHSLDWVFRSAIDPLGCFEDVFAGFQMS